MPRENRARARRRPQQRRSEETIDFILVAADKVFARDGFDDARTEDVARVAGVSIGTLYRYFPAKEALFQALLERIWRDEFEKLGETIASVSNKSLQASIEAIASAFADLQSRTFGRYRASVMHSKDPGKSLLFLAASHERVDAAAEVLAHALEPYRASLAPESLKDASALVIWAVLLLGRVTRSTGAANMRRVAFAEEIPKMISSYLLTPEARLAGSKPTA